MRSLSTTTTNPGHSFCKWIQIRIHYETESRLVQIEYSQSTVPSFT